MRPNALIRAIGEYLMTTSLHGFKYLYAPYGADRLAWVVSCVSSACCAGVLCGVLWTRFIQVPNVLSLQTVIDPAGEVSVMGLCLPTLQLANSVIIKMFGPQYKPLAGPLSRTLQGKRVPEHRLMNLTNLLSKHNSSLQRALLEYSVPCSSLAVRCQANDDWVDCNNLVQKELSPFGPCCVIRPKRLRKLNPKMFPSINSVKLAIEANKEIDFIGYDLITQYKSMPWTWSSRVAPGYLYLAALQFQDIEGGQDNERLSKGKCESDDHYSRHKCLIECVEDACGCADPLSNHVNTELLLCPLTKISCLRNYEIAECDCAYSCRQVTTFMSLEYAPLNAVEYSIDPFYTGLNGSSSIVLSVAVKKIGSHVFTRMPTENWLTLLSSLGGVFNMFLGVGLFSALELLYFMLVKIPFAVRTRTRE